MLLLQPQPHFDCSICQLQTALSHLVCVSHWRHHYTRLAESIFGNKLERRWQPSSLGNCFWPAMEGPESDQQRSKRQDLSEKALDEGEDPLDRLRPRRPQFPSLWRLARKYLCVLATSTEAERLFSWTGFMLNKRRLSLSEETLSMQLKDNIKLWSFNGALVFASKYNHRHAHAIALHMRKPLLCTCAPHCFAHARPIIPRTSTIRKHASGASAREIAKFEEEKKRIFYCSVGRHWQKQCLVCNFLKSFFTGRLYGRWPRVVEPLKCWIYVIRHHEVCTLVQFRTTL